MLHLLRPDRADPPLFLLYSLTLLTCSSSAEARAEPRPATPATSRSHAPPPGRRRQGQTQRRRRLGAEFALKSGEYFNYTLLPTPNLLSLHAPCHQTLPETAHARYQLAVKADERAAPPACCHWVDLERVALQGQDVDTLIA